MHGPSCGCFGCENTREALMRAVFDLTTRKIKIRIRVGVTADGHWSCAGGDPETLGRYTYPDDSVIADDLDSHGPVVAWHWITAEVPMPETEHGDVAGEVER